MMTANEIAGELNRAALDVRCYLDWIESAPDRGHGYGPPNARRGRSALLSVLRSAERDLLDARARISDAALALDEAKAAAKAANSDRGRAGGTVSAPTTVLAWHFLPADGRIAHCRRAPADSDTVPQPIFFGESDCPQHCGDCDEYLYGDCNKADDSDPVGDDLAEELFDNPSPADLDLGDEVPR